MTILRDAQEMSVTEASQRGLAKLVSEAEQGSDLVVTRRHKPVAAVVGIDRLTELERAASDLNDLALVLSRGLTDPGRRTSLDDVLAAFGQTRETLSAQDDDETDNHPAGRSSHQDG
ncbi:type II toxin-antitoxin system Phd/YefM family antitoxin [Streptomyces sp. NPDC016845]|uniref:type II toxin-antitoxin system Phd/YefM family antitoxin n=1 Tax=Streptomyces sp. NPDC016845 TaxID=3364972 RepID=UPI003795E727